MPNVMRLLLPRVGKNNFALRYSIRWAYNAQRGTGAGFNFCGIAIELQLCVVKQFPRAGIIRAFIAGNGAVQHYKTFVRVKDREVVFGTIAGIAVKPGVGNIGALGSGARFHFCNSVRADDVFFFYSRCCASGSRLLRCLLLVFGAGKKQGQGKSRKYKNLFAHGYELKYGYATNITGATVKCK